MILRKDGKEHDLVGTLTQGLAAAVALAITATWAYQIKKAVVVDTVTAVGVTRNIKLFLRYVLVHVPDTQENPGGRVQGVDESPLLSVAQSLT